MKYPQRRNPRRRPVVFALYSLVIAALACNFGGGQPSPATQAAQTVEAVLTASALAPVDGAATPTATPLLEAATEVAGGPSATAPAGATGEVKPSDTAAPSNTPGAQGCVDSSQYVQDVTVPDDSVFPPGMAFTKTWRIRNNGTCNWAGSYSFVFVSGEAMGGPAAVPVAGNVAPGAQYDVSVNMVAPNTPGTYKGTWQLRNSGGALFGTKPFVQIIVAAPSATPTATSASATPTQTATTGGGPWSGAWTTNCGLGLCGDMNLVQTGGTVVGTYAGGDGTINGTVTGNRLTGAWSRAGDSGTLDFWLGGGGQRWRGNFDKVSDWCGARPGLSDPSPCGVATWYGTWTTQCGGSTCNDMTLTQDGTSVSGTYAGGGGTVSGTVNGMELDGTWNRGGSGTFHFYIQGNGLQFRGNWDSINEWCGYRSGSSLPAPCLQN